MTPEIQSAADSIVRQWDEHDRFRVCAGESDEEPAEVAVARAYLALGERQADRYEAHSDDADFVWGGPSPDLEGIKATVRYLKTLGHPTAHVVRVATFTSPVKEVEGT